MRGTISLPGVANVASATSRRRDKPYPKYKTSEIGWIHEIPESWKAPRLRYAISIPTKAEIRDLPRGTTVSFVPMEAVGEFGGLRLDETRQLEEVIGGYTYFRDGDVLVAKITPCFENGKGAIGDKLESGVGFGTTELHVLRPGPELDTRFLFYVTSGGDFRRLGTAEMYGAGGQKRVPEDFIRELRHPLPPLPEQRAIAAFLDRQTAKIDALVEKKRRLIELLKEKRAALISHAVTKGLDPDVPMKDSKIEWLGNVPQHWEVVELRRVLQDVEQGWSPSCDGRPAADGEWGVLKSGCVNSGALDETQNKALPPELVPDPALQVKPRDVLMSRACGTPSLVGSVAYVYTCRSGLLLCDKLFRLRTLDNLIDAQFMVAAIRSSPSRAQIEGAINGAEGLANNITQATVRSIWICLPPKTEQKVIVRDLTRQLETHHALEAKIHLAIDRLLEYRTALISAAVTGKIDVRNQGSEGISG